MGEDTKTGRHGAVVAAIAAVTLMGLVSLFSLQPIAKGPWAHPRILRQSVVQIASLDELSARYGNVKSDVAAKGKARRLSGELVDSDQWKGLVIETLADTIADVKGLKGDHHAEFGSLRATFFSGARPANNSLCELLGNASDFNLPFDIAPFRGYSLWLRNKRAQEGGNAVGWHAHPDSGLYLQLTGTKTFEWVEVEEWKSQPGWELDDTFPLVFGDDQVLAKAKIHSITVRPGDILYQPPWVMHRLMYENQGEYASLRYGFVFWQTLLDEPGLFALTIPGYIKVGTKVALQWLSL